jgi:DNA polymerase III subunit epsilon
MKAGVFDTETTGLIDNLGRPLAKQPYITELFMITADKGNPADETNLSLLIKPPVTITDEIFKITGISNEMVANAPPFRQIAQRVADFIATFDVLIAHNAAFDRDMLLIEFQRLGIELKLPPMICTVEATEWLQGYRLSLGRLHERLFGVDFEDHHRAEPDTRALRRIVFELWERDWL